MNGNESSKPIFSLVPRKVWDMLANPTTPTETSEEQNVLIEALVEADLRLIGAEFKMKQFQRAQEATVTWCDMLDKLAELVNDPGMTREKWLEWLPIFKTADELFIQANPQITAFPSLTLMAEDAIS